MSLLRRDQTLNAKTLAADVMMKVSTSEVAGMSR
jgi:hypothetical protein